MFLTSTLHDFLFVSSFLFSAYRQCKGFLLWIDIAVRDTVIGSEFVFDSEQDNVEQKQTEEQQQQEVMQEALQDTMLKIEVPQKPLSSRESRS